jgi:hypothetical protein
MSPAPQGDAGASAAGIVSGGSTEHRAKAVPARSRTNTSFLLAESDYFPFTGSHLTDFSSVDHVTTGRTSLLRDQMLPLPRIQRPFRLS